MTKTRWFSVAAILCGLLGCPPVLAAPITTGRQAIDINGTPMVVFTYRPATCSDPALLLVFHGIARNARTYRDDARALADRLSLLAVAPVFDKRAFPAWRYQRGGIVKDGVVQNAREWSGTQVLDIIAWARAQEGRPLAYSLLGHSAGAQFRPPRRLRAHRRKTYRDRKRGKLRVSEPRGRRALRAGKGLFGNGWRGGAAALPGTALDHLSRPRKLTPAAPGREFPRLLIIAVLRPISSLH